MLATHTHHEKYNTDISSSLKVVRVNVSRSGCYSKRIQVPFI